MNSRAEFERQLALGRQWEDAVIRYLRSQGVHVITTRDAAPEGAAPRLLAPEEGDRSPALPDIQAARNGRSAWIEVKFKALAPWNRRWACVVTGIGLKAWEDYRRVQAVTGMDVDVWFVHKAEQEVRAASLDTLRYIEVQRYVPRTDDQQVKGLDAGGNIYFKYEEIPRVCSLDELLQR